MNLPRRSVEDIVTRYELEPEIRDVYVEGVFDREILTQCLRKRGDKVKVVYEIDSVDVSGELLDKYGLTSGNKQRVIAFAKELSGRGVENSYHCLVDRDLDHWFNPLESISGLMWTKYNSIELYFLTEDILHSILVATAKSKISDWSVFFSSFIDVLAELYAMRLADRELDLNLSWVDLDKDLGCAGSKLSLDSLGLVDRLINKNSVFDKKVAFVEATALWVGKLEGDPRLHIRGHDFVKMVAWVIKSLKGLKIFSSDEAVERMLVLVSGHVDDLSELIKD
ncbi:DUF4435 domain-containing protein [Pseudomonas sp. MWU12-2029]|uniref:DUF4435 domain-containing protein n=1 Tax=Pseudomonas sp. MWU12-2029 TaxID=2927805 RepID=UPI00200C8A42|nr:DUF4435 domain-containing protein [Pseudomonas sp. MWU12-2029]